MTATPRAFWLELAPEPAFAVFHAADTTAASAATRAPVLLVPPFGWHDVASYRSRRSWAAHLAARGHATLRIDLPGTGDSGGDATTPGLVDAWVAAVGRAATWLCEATNAEAVDVIGLGMGGLVASAAIAAGAPVAAFVAWAVSADGREEVRRQRAFARLQTGRYSLTEPEPVLLPDGWLEINGFVLSAETIAALGRLTVPASSTGTLRRALVLDSDGIAPPPAVVAGLRAAGVDVTVDSGPGWSAMTFHPQHDEPPTAVFETVDRWLDAAPTAVQREAAAGPPSATTSTPPTAAAPVSLLSDGVIVRETALDKVTDDGSHLFGILTAPASPRPASVAAVFLNAGAVRRIGPNRIWVDTARRWAREGIPTLRIDLDAIGDSDGDSGRYRDVGQFYARDALAEQIRLFSDEALARTGASRLILAGLCAGGYWAFVGADRDPRVTAAYLLNPGALEWRTDLVRRRDARRIRRLADPAWWRRLVSGQVRFARIRKVAAAALGEGLRRPGRALAASTLEDAPRDGAPAAILDRLAARGTTVVIAFSGDEALRDELARDGVLDHIATLPNVRLETLPGRDHTLRPIVAQRAVHELLDRALAADLEPVASLAGSGAA